MKLNKKKSLLEGFVSSVTSFGSLRTNQVKNMSNKEVGSLVDTMSDLSTSWIGESSAIIPVLRNFYDSKQMLINEYDKLDPSDGRISAALDQYADSTVIIPAASNENSPYVLSGDKGKVQDIKDIFDNVNLTSELWTWARQLCKVGEIFVVITEPKGEKDSMPSIRLEINPRKYMRLRLNDVYATWDTEYGVFVDNDLDNNDASKKYAEIMKVKQIRVIQIKLSTRTDICRKVEVTLIGNRKLTVEHVTGSSILDPILVTSRIMRMIEDTLIMTRIEKSKITRVYEVEVGKNTSDEKAKLLINKVRRALSGRESMSTIQGSFEKASVSKVMNEIVLPVREGVGSININDIDSVFNAGDMNDLKYFEVKLYAGLKIPKVYLGYEEDTPSSLGGSPLTKVESRYGRSIRRISLSLENGLQDVINAVLGFKTLSKLDNSSKKKSVEVHLIVDTTDEEIAAVQTLRDLADGIRSLLDVADKDDRLDQRDVTKRVIKRYSNTLYDAMYLDENGKEIKLKDVAEPTNTPETPKI